MIHINANPFNEIKPLRTNKKHIFIRECMKQNLIFKHPGICIFSGSQNSGKSTLLIHILSNKYLLGESHDNPDNAYKQYFDKIYLLIGSNDDGYNPLIYKKLILKQDVYKFPTVEDLQGIIEKQENDIISKGIAKSDKILIILDDVIQQKKFMNNPQVLKLFCQDRHINASVFIATQYFVSVPKSARQQANMIFIFKANRAVQECLVDQFCPAGLTKDMFRSIIKLATSDDEKSSHNFLTIDAFNSLNKKFRKNLDQYIVIPGEPKPITIEKEKVEKKEEPIEPIEELLEPIEPIVKIALPRKVFKKLT